MTTFETLAQLGERLSATKKKLEHTALIGEYLKQLPPAEIGIAARLLIGQALPAADAGMLTGRFPVLNVSGAAIERALAQTIGGTSEFAQIDGAVDFGDAVEKLLLRQGHIRQGEPLTLVEVNGIYAEIAGVVGEGSRTRRDMRLRELFTRATPLEAKYIVKHLIHEMRVGVNEGTLLDALARTTGIPGDKIRRAFQLSGDIGWLAQTVLIGGAAALEGRALQLGHPLKPMLAQSAERVANAFEELPLGETALEYKLDGARVQIHKNGNAVRIFSRSLAELTASLPEIVEQAEREIRGADAIVEGEVIALTPEGRPRPFQDVMRRVGREREISTMQTEIPLRLYLFDCLYADGVPLIDEPNVKRWEHLCAVGGEIARVERLVPNSVQAGEEFLARARAAGHEGVMAKHLASPYLPGERGKHWLKIKPVMTLDLAIVAAEWGYGRRTGWLSNVHLAARDETTGELLEVGKTFKGFTDIEFKAMTERLVALKERETRGTVWVRPEVIVEVAFNNVQTSPQYKSRVALRFARILRVRDDKKIDEIDTVQTLRRIVDSG